MSTRIASQQARRRRRTITYLWITALAILTISLIYWELIAMLYVLATLGVAALLVVVATSDLAHAEKGMAADQAAPGGVTVPVGSSANWGAKKLH